MYSIPELSNSSKFFRTSIAYQLESRQEISRVQVYSFWLSAFQGLGTKGFQGSGKGIRESEWLPSMSFWFGVQFRV